MVGFHDGIQLHLLVNIQDVVLVRSLGAMVECLDGEVPVEVVLHGVAFLEAFPLMVAGIFRDVDVLLQLALERFIGFLVLPVFSMQ